VSDRVKPIGNWLCRAVEATTSASIRWIRLIICIWIFVSWVLVSWVLVIACLVDVCIFGYKIVCNCMINHFSTLAYVFWLFVCSVCGFLFLWWSSIYWWEQMWELLVVIKVMEIPLHSLSSIRPCFLLSSLLGPYPMYFLALGALILILLNFFLCVFIGIVVCLSFPSKCSWINIRSNIILYDFALLLFIVMFHLIMLLLKWDVTIYHLLI